MKEIALIPFDLGYVVLIDDEDYSLIFKHRWRAAVNKRRVYAAAKIRIGKKWQTVTMHRLILEVPEVDHKDGNGLNNQRSNLRACSRQENLRNARPRLNTSSQYKGVYQEKRYWRWVAQIKTSTGRLTLGTFGTEEEAARAYDTAAREHFGEFARPNFPEVAA